MSDMDAFPRLPFIQLIFSTFTSDIDNFAILTLNGFSSLQWYLIGHVNT